jgi:hypothetical protein
MNRYKNTGFADRLSAAADAKKAQLERAAQARSEAESPAAVERRNARDAVGVARDARIAERRATKLAVEARQAAALAAAQAAEVAAREAALTNVDPSVQHAFCGYPVKDSEKSTDSVVCAKQPLLVRNFAIAATANSSAVRLIVVPPVIFRHIPMQYRHFLPRICE